MLSVIIILTPSAIEVEGFLLDSIEPLSEDAQRLILCQNAIEAYRLPIEVR